MRFDITNYESTIKLALAKHSQMLLVIEMVRPQLQ